MRRAFLTLALLMLCAAPLGAQQRLAPPKVTTLTGLLGNQGDIVNLVGTGDYVCQPATCTTSTHWKLITAGTATGAPSDATYITQTANSGLSAEQALGALSTGLMNVTTTTGAVTSFVPTDDNVLVGSGTVWALKAVNDCDTASSALTYDATTNAFGCNTISASPGGSTTQIQFNNSSAFGGFGLWDGTRFATASTGGLTLLSGGTTGTYTLAKSGVLMTDASGNEIWRVWGTDPNTSNWNAANLYVGLQAGLAQPTDNTSAGYYNTGVGAFGLAAITEGFSNTAVGYSALSTNTTGDYNAAFGTALSANLSGDSNSGLGVFALDQNTTGSRNTGVGNGAFGYNHTGSDNTGVGYNAGPINGVDNLSNATAIGANSVVAASNRMVFGDANVTDVFFGSETPSAALRAEGYISYGSGLTVANVGADSCGTTAATVAGNYNAFNVTVGATAGTQCRVALPLTAPNRWVCTASNDTTAALARAKYVDTTHVDLLGTFTAGDVINVTCFPR